ncbi:MULTISPECIES: carbamoyl phosphate synthase large subunit [Niallia]|uniref:Carbamoyl phosphate synthase large chain n=1 Tax=Niallia alba TaxID=2729105 RepID=A0A7Y0PLY0_9BACI|nr:MULTISPECIES: carbamoyl phosphate synthase large subunit [Niallia]MBQ6446393.1 carbamoyl phosphate synthase large subunit [Bacillus sp. (in: firmicutes)]NMO76756.1 carbamoyl phosphate synthase large subunit [Niallia alba]UTI39957.1 carbamoyl phosphate synthase large subunit [Niallia sp. RD1]
MPKDTTIKTILVIGSGPIVIGQAAEFDYAGTQACMALKEEGYKVILVNNNPATIMTDETFADSIYFEPLTVDVLEMIIQKEKPDGILATLGGQTGLNLAFQLSEQGILEKYQVKLLGSSIESIKKGEDREAFRELMYQLNEPVPESKVVHEVEEAVDFANEIGFPIIVRPAYTLGGTGGGIAGDMEDFISLVSGGLKESAIGQCLVERSIAGFKEVEYEVMRDSMNTCITICNMENIDPVGIHTGDSIVIAPSQTLTDVEYQMLRSASIKIISALGIIGGCNIQFALDPNSKKYYLIEVNPRVSRSSALASKATGYPIARMAAKLAVGYNLNELINPVTGDTFASFEPALDYVVVKIPKWPFDKFPAVSRKLGTQMKATGEVMGIDRNMERALLKAIRSLEIKGSDLTLPGLKDMTVEALYEKMLEQTDERFFVILELIRKEETVAKIHDLTKIDLFFLNSFKRLIGMEIEIIDCSLQTVTKENLLKWKEKGFSDAFLASAWNSSEKDVREKRKQLEVLPIYKMVDTCAAEFEAKTNYYYSSFYGENEQNKSNKRKVLVIGSGPIRIGQGIEFDYCSVHGVFALKEEGIETIIINNNPETVSTDFATADRLYFEPLTVEDIMNVIESEGIEDVIVQLGGQTALNVAKELEAYGVHILGTNSKTIDVLEDRDLFYKLLEEEDIPHIQGDIAENEQQIVESVKKLGYPVLIRPSYVIGGKGMERINDEEALQFYLQTDVPYPVLVDQFMEASEAELDLAADGMDICVPTIMEHIEKTGVHSGDSLSLLPAKNLSLNVKAKMIEYAQKIVRHTGYKGLMNIQYIINKEDVYVLEVNPRASRTVPIVSKVTGVSLVQIATKILLGKYTFTEEEKVFTDEIAFTCIKYPVYSNYALKGLDSKLGPEMRSTGEGIALADTVEEALKKVFHPTLKKVSKQEMKIVVKTTEDVVDICKKAELVHLSVEMADNKTVESLLADKGTIAFYNPTNLQEDKQSRELATRNRIITFTQKESLEAFISSFKGKELTVHSIQEWHEHIRKGVSTV